MIECLVSNSYPSKHQSWAVTMQQLQLLHICSSHKSTPTTSKACNVTPTEHPAQHAADHIHRDLCKGNRVAGAAGDASWISSCWATWVRPDIHTSKVTVMCDATPAEVNAVRDLQATNLRLSGRPDLAQQLIQLAKPATARFHITLKHPLPSAVLVDRCDTCIPTVALHTSRQQVLQQGQGTHASRLLWQPRANDASDLSYPAAE